MQGEGELASPAAAPAALPGRRKRRTALQVLQEGLAIAEAKLKKQQAAATAKKAAAAAGTGVQQACLNEDGGGGGRGERRVGARRPRRRRQQGGRGQAGGVAGEGEEGGRRRSCSAAEGASDGVCALFFPSAIFQAHAAARKIATFPGRLRRPQAWGVPAQAARESRALLKIL